MGVLDRFRLDVKRLYITGESRGLDREMALEIADSYADIAPAGRNAGARIDPRRCGVRRIT